MWKEFLLNNNAINNSKGVFYARKRRTKFGTTS